MNTQERIPMRAGPRRRDRFWISAGGAGLLAGLAAIALAVPAMQVDPMCPVSQQPCDPKVSFDFHGGRVWFCGPKCRQIFEDNPAAYAAAGHLQMVLTRQFVQRACPLDGAPVAAGVQVDVGGVNVGFCSDACHSRVENATSAEALLQSGLQPPGGEAVLGQNGLKSARTAAENGLGSSAPT
jgi:YHS domain-containing protein